MKRSFAWLAVLLVFSLTALSADDDYRDREDVEKLLKQLTEAKTLTEKVEQASAYFLGRTVSDGPLGEGKDGKYDNDPLCRTDKFDCTTYLETVMAASLASDWKDFTTKLDNIRYEKGRISFTTRNHFAELEWLENAKTMKLVEDITAKIGEKAVLPAETSIKKAAWYAKFDEKRITRPDLKDDEKTKLLVDLKAETKDIKDAKAAFSYLPFTAILNYSAEQLAERKTAETAIREKFKDDKAKIRTELASYRRELMKKYPKAVNHDLLKKIPNATIVNYVHPDRPLEKFIGTNMLVTHQGFLIWKDGVLYARHASIADKVKDIPFLEYIDLFTTPSALESRGVQLLKLQTP